MYQNDIIKEIRIVIIQLFGESFIEAVDSFDKYSSILKENILISEFDLILEKKQMIDKLIDESKEKFYVLKKDNPIIFDQLNKCMNEIEMMRKETSRDYSEEILEIFNENYEEIKKLSIKKVQDFTGKNIDEADVPIFVKNFWIKSYRLTLKKTKEHNFNYFQDNFLNKKYNSVLTTLLNVKLS